MNVLLLASEIVPSPRSCLPGPATQTGSPSLSLMNHRSSPGLAGLGCIGSSQGANQMINQLPSSESGGLVA